MSLSGGELIVVLIIFLLVFGGSSLPKLAKNLGEAQREFKQGLDEAAHESEDAGRSEATDEP